MKKSNSVRKLAAIPIYNEAETIASVVRNARNYADEIVVIDDGSSDNSANIAESCGAKVISHNTNLGKGQAIQTALNYSCNNNYDVTIFLDGDGQHSPHQIPRLVRPILVDSADLVIGSRYLSGNQSTPLFRRIGQIITDYAIYYLSGMKLSDSQSGFRALSAGLAHAIELQSSSMSAEIEMIEEAKRVGAVTREVPIELQYYDDRGHTHRMSRQIIIVWSYIIKNILYKSLSNIREIK